MACESTTTASSDATSLNVAEVGCSLWTHQMHCYRPVPHLGSLPDHAELLWRNFQNVYFAFGRQWKFIPELYLITAGTFVGSRVSSTVLVFPLSGSSCTRGIWFCSSTISPPISFEFIASSTSVNTWFTYSSPFVSAKTLVIENSSTAHRQKLSRDEPWGAKGSAWDHSPSPCGSGCRAPPGDRTDLPAPIH